MLLEQDISMETQNFVELSKNNYFTRSTEIDLEAHSNLPGKLLHVKKLNCIFIG